MTDLLVTNGTVYTMDPSRPVVRSVACSGGLVESLDETPAAKRTLDLKGRTVFPGFIDAHVHLLQYGRAKRGLDLTGVTAHDELVRRVAERAATLPKGEWVYGAGFALEGALPPHGRLSAATPDHPVWLIRKDVHSGLANAKAMERATLDAVPPGGKIDRERGAFYETALRLIDEQVPHDSAATTFLAAQRDAMQYGITGVHDAAVDGEYLRLLQSLQDGRSLRIRVHALYTDDDPDRLIDFMTSRPPVSGRLSSRAIKLFMDGSLGSGTAWMLDPPGGISRLSADLVEKIGRVALEKGYQVCTHAIGDRANRELLAAYERLDAPESARWRIEHAQHVDPGDFERAGRWIASIQPSHCVADRPSIPDRLIPGSYAWKRLGRLALGTDAPVDRLDPRWTFYCAVTREGWGGEHCLTPEEAIRGMTADAAYAGFMDGGVLAPGRPADMVVLSHDWLKADPKDVLTSEVMATLMDGRIGYMSRAFRG